MEHATRAVLEADLQLAEQVIAEGPRVDDLRAAAEEKAFGLLALQHPVATDLVIIVGIHGAGDIERMGDLALRPRRAWPSPTPCCPTRWPPYFAEMGRIGVALARKATEVIRSRTSRWPSHLETTTTRWTTCTGTCSAFSWTRAGPTASARRSTSRSWPASTSATPTTRCGGAPDRLRGDRADARTSAPV